MSRRVQIGHKPSMTGLLIFGLGVCNVGGGCLTSNLSKEDPQTVVVEIGQAEQNQAPLPARIPIHERVYQGDKVISDRVAFLGWDFNQDRQIDMLEILNAQGLVVERAYDFNLDGTPDVTVKVTDALPPPPPDAASTAPVGPTAPSSDH